VTLTPASVDELYKRYAPAAYRRARCVLGNESDAHEVVHDVFVSLLERPEQYKGLSQLTTFMYSVVTHACLNRVRNQRNRLRLVRQTLPVLGHEADRALTPETTSVLRSVLGQMPEELAAAAVYYHLDGMTHEEIARVMECSPRHVGDLLVRLKTWSLRRETT
jgi:RNA polymerase sigma-70 factor (ECF subfamily)